LSGTIVLGGSGESTREGADLGQLHGAFDGGMAGENLLDQGRTGSWQPDDENRLVRRFSPAATLREEVPGEQGFAPLFVGRVLVGGIGLFGAPQPGAFLIVGEGCGVVAGVLERLAEGKAQVEPVFGRYIGAIDLPQHG
jgi:hypothetical protein